MAVNRYSIYPANFTGGATLNLTQLAAQTIDLASTIDEIIPSGAVDRAANTLNNSQSVVRLTTADLVAPFALTNFATVGANFTSTCTIRTQQRLAGGVFTGGAVDCTYTAQKGFLLPMSLAAAVNQPAVLEMMFYPLWDGTNELLIADDAADVSTPTPAFGSQFYHGPAYNGANQLEGLISTRIDFGLAFDLVIADGDQWARAGSIIRRAPRISMTFLKLDMVDTDPGASAAQLASLFNDTPDGAIAVYFRRAQSGGTRDTYAATTNCKVSATTGTWSAGEISVAGEDSATITIDVLPTSALTVSTASAIP